MKEKAIFYNNKLSNKINSSIIKINNSKNNSTTENKIVLDKILINLDLIAKESKQQDDIFCDILFKRMNSVFKLFAHKESLVKKKLNLIKNWHLLYSRVFPDNFDNWTENSIKSISFFGLNEAIKHHCGIELDRIDKSESFALKIISLMEDVVAEKNDDEYHNFALSQPHYANYLSNSYRNGRKSLGKNPLVYSPKIVRKDCSLSLHKQIAVFKKFEKIIKGGVMFDSSYNSKEIALEDHLNVLVKSELHAFSIRNSTS
jgi:anaerobic ribonucleoside-triphosphate reductase